MKISNAEVRAAARWLQRRDITPSELSPRDFARAAKESNVGFRETARLIIESSEEIDTSSEESFPQGR